jgi:hypothetical protein
MKAPFLTNILVVPQVTVMEREIKFGF